MFEINCYDDFSFSGFFFEWFMDESFEVRVNVYYSFLLMFLCLKSSSYFDIYEVVEELLLLKVEDEV